MQQKTRPSSAPPARPKDRSVIIYENLNKANDMVGLRRRLEETVHKTPHFVDDIKKINVAIEIEQDGLKRKTGKENLNSRKALLNRMRQTRDSVVDFQSAILKAQALADPKITEEAEEQVKKAVTENELYIFKGLVEKKIPDRKPLERPWQTRRRRKKYEETTKRQGQDSKKDGPTWSQAHESAFKAFTVYLQKQKSHLASADELVAMTAFLHYNSKLVHRLDKATIQLCREQKALEHFCEMKHSLKRIGKRPYDMFTTLGIGYTSKDQVSWRHLRWVLDKDDILISPEDLHLSVCRCLGLATASTTGCTLLEFERALSVAENVRQELDPIGVRDLPMTWAEVQELTWVVSNEEDQEKAKTLTVDNAMTAKTKDRLRQAMLEESSSPKSHRDMMMSVNEKPSHQSGRRMSAGTEVRTAIKMAKWTENERSLAEQKVAEGIIQQHEAFIWNYVKARNSFLKKRVQNQRDQNKRKQHERKLREDAERKREDFQKSMKHTKFLLKLYDQNRSAEELGCEVVHPTHSPFKKSVGRSGSVETLGFNERPQSRKPSDVEEGISSPDQEKNSKFRIPMAKSVQFQPVDGADSPPASSASPNLSPKGLTPKAGLSPAVSMLTPMQSLDIDGSHSKHLSRETRYHRSLSHTNPSKLKRNGTANTQHSHEKVGLADVIERKSDKIKISCANLASVSASYTTRVVREGGGSGDYLSKSRYRKKATEAASRLQRLFRRHIFWRNVWSQSYLRKPQHVLQIFQRLIPYPKHPGQLRRMNTVNHLSDCTRIEHHWHWHNDGVHPDVVWDHQDIDLIMVEKLLAEMQIPYTEEGYKAAIKDIKDLLKTSSIGDIAIRGLRHAAQEDPYSKHGWNMHKQGKICYAQFKEWWHKHLPFYTDNLEWMIKSIHCAEKQHKLEIAGTHEKAAGLGKMEVEELPGKQNEKYQSKLKRSKSNQQGVVPKLDSDQLQAGTANKKIRQPRRGSTRVLNVSQMVQQAVARSRHASALSEVGPESICGNPNPISHDRPVSRSSSTPKILIVKKKDSPPSTTSTVGNSKEGRGKVVPHRETTIFKNTTGYFLEKRQFLTTSSAPSLRTLNVGTPTKKGYHNRSLLRAKAQKRAMAHSQKLNKVIAEHSSTT